MHSYTGKEDQIYICMYSLYIYILVSKLSNLMTVVIMICVFHSLEVKLGQEQLDIRL